MRPQTTPLVRIEEFWEWESLGISRNCCFSLLEVVFPLDWNGKAMESIDTSQNLSVVQRGVIHWDPSMCKVGAATSFPDITSWMQGKR